MKFIPILFSTAMVQAILAGRKTQTRRILTKQNSRCTTLLTGDGQGWHSLNFDDVVIDGKSTSEMYLKVAVPENETRHRVFSKYAVGDVLWVRETFLERGFIGNYAYKADDPDPMDDYEKWKPSIFMPKDACRIFLKIKSIKVERLQDISPGDACDEGVEYWNIDHEALEGGELVADFKNYNWRDDETYKDYHFPTYANPVDSFFSLWENINGEESLKANPWVWAIEFEQIEKPENFLS